MLQMNPFTSRGRGGWPSFYGRSRRPLDPDAAALVARMLVAPTATGAARIGRLVGDLKAAALWDRIAILHLHAIHDAQAAGLNWRGTTFTATPVNAPDFLADRGFQGDGSTSYLDLGAGYAAVPLIGLGDHAELVWSLSDISSTGRDAGAATTANTAVVGRQSPGNLSVRANSVATTLTATAANSLGLYGFSRSGASVQVVKDGGVLATHTDTATAYATGNLTTLRGAATYSTRRIAVRVVSRHLDAAGHVALHGALQAYLQAIGAI